MPFICENVTNAPLYKKAATGFSKDHIKIKPLSIPKTSLGREFVLRTCFMPASYRKDADEIHRHTVHQSDVWIVGFPKSGTLLVQHVVWLLLNDFNYEKLNTIPSHQQSVLIE